MSASSNGAVLASPRPQAPPDETSPLPGEHVSIYPALNDENHTSGPNPHAPNATAVSNPAKSSSIITPDAAPSVSISRHTAKDSKDGWKPNESFRAQAPGRFASLSQGRVHYRIFGADRGVSLTSEPPIVCVHGINAELTIWQHFVDHFAAAGRVVLAFDLYGRGYSDGTQAKNNLDLFVTQLRELLDHADVKSAIATDPIDLVGVSLGGGIATGFTAKFPERVRNIVLVAPTGLGLPFGGGLAQVLCKLQPLGEALVKLATRNLEDSMKSAFGNPTDPEVLAYLPQAAARVREIDANCPGYLPSFVSTIGYFPLEDMQQQFACLGASHPHALVVWGELDKVVDFVRDSPRLRKLMGAANMRVLAGSGHIDHFVIERFRAQFHAVVQAYLCSATV